MSVMTLPPEGVSEYTHPIDVLEHIAIAEDWNYERDEESLQMDWTGMSSSYFLEFKWLEDLETLHLACSFDLKVLTPRLKEVRELIRAVNEQAWVGHFDFWHEPCTVLFRYSLLLSGGSELSPTQCQSMIDLVAAACDKYFQAFQLVVWAGKTTHEALQIVEFVTEGEA